MNIDFNFPLLALDGEPVLNEKNQPVIAGQVLANVLVSQPQGDILKLFEWALSFHRGDVIKLDSSDQQALKTFIKENNSMTILLKHSLLKAMEKKRPEAVSAGENHKEEINTQEY